MSLLLLLEEDARVRRRALDDLSAGFVLGWRRHSTGLVTRGLPRSLRMRGGGRAPCATSPMRDDGGRSEWEGVGASPAALTSSMMRPRQAS